MKLRVQIGPRNFRSGNAAVTMVTTSLVLLGIAMVLIVRSPFRMPVGERVFRALWLGGFGRWFLRRAAHGITPSVTSSTGNTGAPVVIPALVVKRGSPDGVTLGDLERRVRALEHWKDSSMRRVFHNAKPR